MASTTPQTQNDILNEIAALEHLKMKFHEDQSTTKELQDLIVELLAKYDDIQTRVRKYKGS
jgi:hypothetical protein